MKLSNDIILFSKGIGSCELQGHLLSWALSSYFYAVFVEIERCHLGYVLSGVGYLHASYFLEYVVVPDLQWFAFPIEVIHYCLSNFLSCKVL
jgi:hypothetical protein